jgi:hypothetical protein
MSSDDILTFLNEMTTRRIFKTHLPKDLMPVQVWDKKPKVNVPNDSYKYTVFHINTKINIKWQSMATDYRDLVSSGPPLFGLISNETA